MRALEHVQNSAPRLVYLVFFRVFFAGLRAADFFAAGPVFFFARAPDNDTAYTTPVPLIGATIA